MSCREKKVYADRARYCSDCKVERNRTNKKKHYYKKRAVTTKRKKFKASSGVVLIDEENTGDDDSDDQEGEEEEEQIIDEPETPLERLQASTQGQSTVDENTILGYHLHVAALLEARQKLNDCLGSGIEEKLVEIKETEDRLRVEGKRIADEDERLKAKDISITEREVALKNREDKFIKLRETFKIWDQNFRNELVTIATSSRSLVQIHDGIANSVEKM